ncbi:MAG TPA: transglutaminase-like domain-containing protein, partial [Rectinemataceae bacterium]|nr:transglutaminase-like domain-containing protein [Rectinemataceae bacterium]
FKDSFADGKAPEFLQSYLIDDALVPARAKDLLSLAAKIVGKEKNLQKKASLLWDWLKKNIAWKATSGSRDSPLSAIKDGRAGTRQYSLLACALFRAAAIPAVPLSGFLVRKDGVSIPHFWLEYYLPAIGWIPFDPALGLGSKPGGFDASLDNPSHYFGSLDNRHIAISRGITDVAPMLGGADMQTSKVQWSFQTLFEESIGGAYESTWHDIEVLGVY